MLLFTSREIEEARSNKAAALPKGSCPLLGTLRRQRIIRQPNEQRAAAITWDVEEAKTNEAAARPKDCCKLQGISRDTEEAKTNETAARPQGCCPLQETSRTKRAIRQQHVHRAAANYKEHRGGKD